MNANNGQIGGDHYISMRVQPWDVMEAAMTHEEFIGYMKGNIIKYLLRYQRKGGVEDLRKMHHYTEKLIEITEKNL